MNCYGMISMAYYEVKNAKCKRIIVLNKIINYSMLT